jgi:hypothetical protein
MSDDCAKNHKLQIRCGEKTAKRFHMIRANMMFTDGNRDIDHEKTLIALMDTFEEKDGTNVYTKRSRIK